MSKLPVFVGLDYHQSVVQVCVMDASGRVLTNQKCRNDWQTIAEIVPRNHLVHAAIEACNGAADLADQLVAKAGWSVDLAHAGYVARIKQSPDKTDFGDAQLLADLERVGYLPRVWRAPQWIRELRRLVRYRQQLAAQRRRVKLRIRSLLRDHRLSHGSAAPWTKRWLTWLASTDQLSCQSRWIMDEHLRELDELGKRILLTERKLQEVTADDSLTQRLQEERGCGLITSVTIRAEIGRFDRFRSGKQLARFCGLSPRNASSGTRQGDAGVIKAGNPELRRVLTQAAQRLIRYEEHWLKMAYRMRTSGKATCVIVAAVANRWMRRLYHDMKEHQLAI